MRVLGVDFGSRRIGLAVGDTDTGVASSARTLDASGALKRDAEAIAAVASSEEAALVVVGLPLDEEGGPTPMSRVCSQLASRIEELGWQVRTVDESRSSIEAEEGLVYERASQRRRRRDGAAACVILERFFREQTA